MNINAVIKQYMIYFEQIKEVLQGPVVYAQFALILISVVSAFYLSRIIKDKAPIFKQVPSQGKLLSIKKNIHSMGELIFPLLNIFFLIIFANIAMDTLENNWLIKIAESLAIVYFLYRTVTKFIKNALIRALIKWVIIPIALLQIIGWLDYVITYLDSISVKFGQIRFSLYGLARLFIFGAILFWLGRISNTVGQQIIRNQQDLDVGTREVFVKLFEVSLYIVIFILLLQLIGINLTALAVFGGALGVGLGFGLQSIASNFISGIIILLDRSIAVGDFIELENGQSGTIRQLNMRSAILETYDGKDIMVPNEQFITTNFINWTHKNNKQRYPIELSVSYDTDIDVLIPLLKEVVSSHPQVISGENATEEERPDAEIAGFGDSGIDILIEFWMEGVDDGPNRVAADLLYMIWKALKENNIEIPYPQREVRILNNGSNNPST